MKGSGATLLATLDLGFWDELSIPAALLLIFASQRTYPVLRVVSNVPPERAGKAKRNALLRLVYKYAALNKRSRKNEDWVDSRPLL